MGLWFSVSRGNNDLFRGSCNPHCTALPNESSPSIVLESIVYAYCIYNPIQAKISKASFIVSLPHNGMQMRTLLTWLSLCMSVKVEAN